MAARLFEIIQFFDNNGILLAGGKVHTFEAGTTTPKASFVDSGGVTPHPNPVILDSSGRAQIWLSGTPYRLQIDDANDVTILTLDNVAGTTALLGASISARASATRTVSCNNGEVVLTASSIFPANARALGAYTKNVVPPGTSNGLSGYDVGSHGLPSRWGTNIGLGPTDQNTIGDFLADQPTSPLTQDVTITVQGGPCDGVGIIEVTVDYETGTAL